MNKIVLYSLLAIVVVVSSCKNTTKTASKLTTIRIGYQLGHVPCIIAKHNKLFEEEFIKDNIKIEISKFDYGPPEVEAFNAKKIDVGTMGDQPAIVGWSHGVDFKIVGNSNGGNTKMALLVPVTSKVQSFRELKNKKIAIAIGSNNQHFLSILLKKEGFTLSDIDLINLKFGDCISSLSQGLIDATIVSEPYITLAVYKKGARIITYSGGYKYVTLPILSSGNFVKNYPDILKRILKVYRKAAEWGKNHPNETTDILLKEENNLLPREVDYSLIDKYTANFGLGGREIKAFEETFQFLKETNLISTNKDLKTFYDSQFDRLTN